jgi:hypothetical protein
MNRSGAQGKTFTLCLAGITIVAPCAESNPVATNELQNKTGQDADFASAVNCGWPLNSIFAFSHAIRKFNIFNDLGGRQVGDSTVCALARILSYKRLSFPFFTSTPLSFVRPQEGGWTKLSFWAFAHLTGVLSGRSMFLDGRGLGNPRPTFWSKSQCCLLRSDFLFFL